MRFPTRYVHISVGIYTLVQVPVKARRGHQIPLELELPMVMSLLTWEEQNQGPLKEQEELLSAKPPRQSPYVFLTDFILEQF